MHSFINEIKQQYTYSIAFNNCKPRFIHEFALSKLKSQGYKIAICSNSIRDSIAMMMERAALLKYADVVISNQDVKKPKPDPEMYIEAAKKLWVKPEECLILEDNENGIKAAQASGGNLMIIKTPDEVNYGKIISRIKEIEAK